MQRPSRRSISINDEQREVIRRDSFVMADNGYISSITRNFTCQSEMPPIPVPESLEQETNLLIIPLADGH